MISLVKATPRFKKLADKWLSPDALQTLIDELAMHPESGAIIKGTGGLRKLRWRTGKDNKGKRGGVRIIYCYEREVIILLITLYKKSNQEDMDEKEKAEIKKLLPELVRRSSDV